MPRTETEQLVVSLEARIAQFERNFAKANRTASQNWTQIERRSQQASTRMQAHMAQATAGVTAFSNSLTRITAALGVFGVGAIGFSTVTSAIRGTLESIDELSKASRRVGVSVEALQAFRRGAELAGLSVSSLDTNLERFAKRLGEADRGTGELKKVIDANNISLRDAEGRFKSTTDLLGEFADLIAKAESPQEKLAIATAAFGREGAEMVEVLSGGAAGLREMQTELSRTTDLTTLQAKAIEVLNDRYTTLGHTVVGVWDQIVASTVVGMQLQEQAGEQLVTTISGMLDRLLGTDITEWLTGQRRAAAEGLADLEAELAGSPLQVAITDDDIPGANPRPAAPSEPRIIPPSPSKRSLLAEPFTTPLGDPEAERRLEQLQATRDLTKEATAATEELSAAEIAAANAGQQFALTVSQGLTQAITGASSFDDALKGVIAQLAEAIIQAIIFRSISGAIGSAGTATTAGTGLLGLFAGGFAQGGTIPAGRFGLVGERGPELISGPARITPMAAQSITLAPQTTINVSVEGGSKGPAADRELAESIGEEYASGEHRGRDA